MQMMSFFVSRVINESKDYAQYFVITNLTQMKSKVEPQKPLALTITHARTLFKHSLDDDGCSLFHMHDERSRVSDEKLSVECPKWLKKREASWSVIEQFQSDEKILKYLQGMLGYQIAERAADLNVNEKVIRRALNRYVSNGCRKNALLPIAYGNVGNGKRVYKTKPGPKNTLLPVLRTRMIEPSDIVKVQRLAVRNCVDKKDGKFCLKRLHILFLKEHCSTEVVVERGGETHFELAVDESKKINYQQFKRLFNKAFDPQQQQVLKVGKSAYENNRKDMVGSAFEGATRAGQLCESDSTELPLYVAYPLNKEKIEAAGKPTLCIVVCVRTQMVMGYSLGFSSPKWISVAEALVNCVQNKKEYAKQYNVHIDDDDWSCQHLPLSIRLDNGGENATKQFNMVLKGELGIAIADYCPPANGAGKGTVEHILHIIQGFLSNITGSVEKERDAGIQHASQRAVLLIEDVHRLIIQAICIHNTMNSRERLLTTEMAMNEVIQTPSAMWSYLMSDELLGRPRMSQKRLPELVYLLMPKLKATVHRNEISLKGLGYFSDWAERKGWFAKATSARFKIDVISLGGTVDTIYFKDEEGELQPLSLKKEYEMYEGMTELQAKYQLNQIKGNRKELEHKKENALVNFEHEVEQAVEYRLNNDFKDAPPNTQKTIQGGITERKAIMIEDEQRMKAEKLANIMQVSSLRKGANEQSDSDDDYDCEDIY
ncbi:hypothetical protein [Pseudoalteromonas sp. SaAl2]